MFIFKLVKSANSGAWLVPIFGYFCFMRPYFVTSINFYVTDYSQLFLHASHVSLDSFFLLSIQRLFLRDLSSNLINFADTSSVFKGSSSVALTFIFKFFISFQVGHPTLCVTFSICLSIRPSVHLFVRCAPYLRNHTSSNHNFLYTCVK